MKLLLGLILVTFVATTPAQAPAPDSIVFGNVWVSLGAQEQSVLRALREYYDVSEVQDQFSIMLKGNKDAYEGVVSFRDGRVSSITKNWNLFSQNTQEALARAVYGAFTKFGQSRAGCGVTTFDNQQPEMQKRGVAITCGQRTVEIFITRVVFGNRSVDLVVVNESLSD